jgi:uncharacterized protein YnzC (UPF0291/DUF896 family)
LAVGKGEYYMTKKPTKAALSPEEKENNKKVWGEFLEAIRNTKKEGLTGASQWLKFKTPEEIDLL